MHKLPPRGITLLETVIYIGVISFILPAFIVLVLRVWQQQIGFDARLRLEQTTALIFLELDSAITEADAIRVSSSTLGTDTSSLVFEDQNGTVVTIDLVSTTISFSGTNQTVRRLRLTRGSNDPVWLTEPEHDVTQWRAEAVRDVDSNLTGLRFSFDAELINGGGQVFRQASFAGDTTVALSPNTTEL